MFKNLPANAGARFNPCLGKIPHAVGQLSPGTPTTEALACLGSATREVASVRSLRTSAREQPLLPAAREEPVCNNKDPVQPEIY